MYPIIPEGYKIPTGLTNCKIKDFVWDSPCNLRETAALATSYTGSIKCLIYKEKRRFSTSLS